MYDKLVADVTTRVEANLIHIIDQSIDVRIKVALDPMGLESGVIREIVQAELKSKIDNLDIDMYISDWMGCNFDISDYEHNLEIEDKISPLHKLLLVQMIQVGRKPHWPTFLPSVTLESNLM